MTPEEVSLLHMGSYLMPNSGLVESAIRVIEINEQGFRFHRCNLYYAGEEFFLSTNALTNSNWVVVPVSTQLLLF